MNTAVVIAADGAEWESRLLAALDAEELGISIVRRCMDVVEMTSFALTGQATVALVSCRLKGLDRDVVDQLAIAGVTPVAVTHDPRPGVIESIRAKGIRHVVAADAHPGVVATAVHDAAAGEPVLETRSFALTGPRTQDSDVESGEPIVAAMRPTGRVIAVWGPAGAPGRTTVATALADEISRSRTEVLLVDADVYGGTVATRLGIIDESPGLAAACRLGSTAHSDPAALAELAWQLGPWLRVLTGIPIAQRWPEVRPTAVESVLTTCRAMANWVVVDLGFSIEADEELSFDTIAPRRNGATLAVLDVADVILVVGDCDPVGIQRLAYALLELEESGHGGAVQVVLNKVRSAFASGDAGAEAAAALERLASRTPAVCLPYDREALDVSLATGRSLAEVRPRCRLRQSMAGFVQTLTGVPARSRRHARK